MAINFPDSPTIGDEFTGGGFTWTWTGTAWEKVATQAVANNFTLVTTSDNSYVLDRVYPAGKYSIAISDSDTTYDVYVIAKDDSLSGYTKTSSLQAANDFDQIMLLGIQSGVEVIFEYQGAITSPTASGDIVTAGAYVTSVATSSLPNIDDTTIITGGNFATDVVVTFTGTDTIVRDAKSVVRTSSTQLIVTRPDNFLEDNSPYTITVSNPGIPLPTSSNVHILENSVTAGGTPTWSTTESLPPFIANEPYSTILVAIDPEGSSISYTVVSGSLPTGLSLNSATGEISGTTAETSATNFVVRATDNGLNFLDKSFSLGPKPTLSGGTLYSDETYSYRKFTANDTLQVANGPISVDYMIVAGGGAGGWAASQYTAGGGGGAGGYLSNSSLLSPASYPILVGAGGPVSTNASSGSASSFNGVSASGGGGGAGNNSGSSGGSGGGGSYYHVSGYAGIAGQGFGGGTAAYAGGGVMGGGGGGGGASERGQDGIQLQSGRGGKGGDGLNTNSSWATATSSGDNGYYAGGGGGTGYSGNGVGGQGGGGDGQNSGGQAGMANTGGGGGGSNGSSYGGAGGSGIVIIRYLTADAA